MVMRDIGSFHCPEPGFISRDGIKHKDLKQVVTNLLRRIVFYLNDAGGEFSSRHLELY